MAEHPRKNGKMQTVNTETGEVISEKANTFTLLPCSPDVCQECGVDHQHDRPHNQQSAYYQMRFHGMHGRYPTWSDAMSHCSPEIRAQCRRVLQKILRERGLEIPADLLDDKPAGR